jgi:hypothetical protein
VLAFAFASHRFVRLTAAFVAVSLLCCCVHAQSRNVSQVELGAVHLSTAPSSASPAAGAAASPAAGNISPEVALALSQAPAPPAQQGTGLTVFHEEADRFSSPLQAPGVSGGACRVP